MERPIDSSDRVGRSLKIGTFMRWLTGEVGSGIGSPPTESAGEVRQKPDGPFSVASGRLPGLHEVTVDGRRDPWQQHCRLAVVIEPLVGAALPPHRNDVA